MLISQLQMMNRMLNQQAAMAMPQMGSRFEYEDGTENGRASWSET